LELRPATIVSYVAAIVPDIATIAEDIAILRICGSLRCRRRALIRADRGWVVVRTVEADVAHVTTYCTVVRANFAPIPRDVTSVPASVPPVVTNVAKIGAPIVANATPGSVRWCQSHDLRTSRDCSYGKGGSRCCEDKSVPHVNPPSCGVKATLNARSGE
jgi:hypothetical protein